MYKKRSFFKYIFLPLIFVISLIFGIGEGSFVSTDTYETDLIDFNTGKAVCYSGNVKYASIEKALSSVSSGTIYVIPGTNPTIKSNCEIKSGVTLCIPYEDNLSNTHNYLNEKGQNGNTGIGYADNSPETYLKNTITVAQGVNINVYGTIQLGGETGLGASPQGGTVGKYCSFNLAPSVIFTFNSGSIFECYGFVKELENNTTNLAFLNGSILKTPISFYDYDSAGNVLDRKEKGVFPFKQFDIAGIRSKMTFDYGSKLIGKIHTYGSTAGDVNNEPTLIGTADSFINLTTGAVLTWDFDETSSLTKTTNNMKTHVTNITISGKASFGHMAIQIKKLFAKYDIDSKDFYLPIPFSFNILLKENSSIELPSTIKGVKFMPGTSVICEKNTTIDANCSVLFYQSNKASDGKTTFNYPSSVASKLITRGTININSGFEGVVEIAENSNDDEGKLVIGSGYSPVTDSKEMTDSAIYSWGGCQGMCLKKVYVENSDTDFSYQLKGNTYFSKNCTYKTKCIVNSNELGWFADNSDDIVYRIKYQNDLIESSNPNIDNDIISFDLSNQETPILNLVSNNDKYGFDGFYYDNNYENKLGTNSDGNFVISSALVKSNNYTNGKNYLTLYAKRNDLAQGTYTLSKITKKQSSDKLSLIENLPITEVLPTNESLKLENKAGFKTYYYDSINPSNGFNFHKCDFNGYTLSLYSSKDAYNNGESPAKEIVVDVNGNSSGGESSNYTINIDILGVKKDNYLVAKENWNDEKQAITLSISGDTSILKQGGDRNFNVTGIDTLTLYNVSLSYLWESSDSKVYPNGSSTDNLCNFYNAHTETTKWARNVESPPISLTCSVSDGSIVLRNLSASLKIEKVILKVF